VWQQDVTKGYVAALEEQAPGEAPGRATAEALQTELDPKKECPYCGELAAAGAERCKTCGTGL
jgi:hypothetical protein